MEAQYVIGLDYGTDSVRAVLVNALDGEELASSVKYYPRWKEGKYCDPARDQYRQHPLDYIETFTDSVREALSLCPPGTASRVRGIAFDTTGSTPVLINRQGIPLSLLPDFSSNPDAMFVLWKDHTAVREADEINHLAAVWKTDYTRYEGGIYSSEWVWAKILQVLRHDASLRKEAWSWAEHCDWMPALITGNTCPETMKRSRCAAGHKAMWHTDWGGLPDQQFLSTLDPLFEGIRERLYTETQTSDQVAGLLTPEWAKKLGLPSGIKVGVGAFDAHMGAVGGEVEDHAFVRIMGTSTCDIMTASYEEIGDRLIPGICGQVDGYVIPGKIGLEAGQSAFGDVYAWFKSLLAWPLQDLEDEALSEKIENRILQRLAEEAALLPLESSEFATDWINGRRTPDANQWVKGTLSGITLGTTAPMVFKSLVEATAFGSKAIVDRFLQNGIRIDRIIALGGVAKKSPYVMQTLSDVLNMPIRIAASDQTCALGAAMFAAVNAGIHPSLEKAQKAMGKGFEKEYTPNSERAAQYQTLFFRYLKLGKITEEQFFKP